MTDTTAPKVAQLKTPADKLAWIERWLSAGCDIYVQTYTRSTKISPKVWAAWREHGGFFKVSGGRLLMRRGRKAWDCIDFCGLKAV